MSNDVTGSIYNIYSQANVASGASLTNLYSVYIGATGLNGSTITNNYGLYQAGASEKNYFAGNVGIRTTNPQGDLTVSNAGAEGIEFFAASGGNINSTQHYNRSSAVYVTNKTIAADHQWFNGGSEKMRIEAGGQVVLTASTPSIKMVDSDDNSAQFIQAYGGFLRYYADDNNILSGSEHAWFVDGTRKMTLDSSGELGIGTSGPAAKLHVYTGADSTEGTPHVRIEGSGYSGFHWLNGTAYYIGQNSNGRQLRMYSGSNSAVGVYLTNGGTSWQSYSDERLKENIQDIGSVIEKIKDIRCVTYNRKDVDDENKHETIGFIAQDFVGKFDQVLDESKVSDTDEETRYSMKYTETIPILMKAIQEQQTIIDDLKSRIEALEE